LKPSLCSPILKPNRLLAKLGSGALAPSIYKAKAIISYDFCKKSNTYCILIGFKKKRIKSKRVEQDLDNHLIEYLQKIKKDHENRISLKLDFDRNHFHGYGITREYFH
jgi:hypothetical protein